MGFWAGILVAGGVVLLGVIVLGVWLLVQAFFRLAR